MPQIFFKKRLIVLISVILFLIIGGFYFWNFNLKGDDVSAAGESWITGWGYRKPVTVTNSIAWLSGWTYRMPVTIANSSGSALANYQVKLSITYNSHMKSDFSDLRFSSDGTTLLNYWIESYTASTSAIVWVNVPSIATGNSTMYMYYGNSSATSAANGDNTFNFFDDFLGTTYNTSKWELGYSPTITVSGGTATIKGATSNWESFHSTSAYSFGPGYALEYLPTAFYTSTYGYAYGLHAFFGSSGDWNGVYFRNSAVGRSYGYGDVSMNFVGYPNVIHKIAYLSGSTIFAVGSTSATNTSGNSGGSYRVNFLITADSGIGGIQLDWVRVRKYVSSEPTSTFGTEETSTLANYQVRLSVSYVSSKMNADFSDLRFTSSDGTTLLNYWIESYTASTSAIVWVKVPSLVAGSNTIYMYYGNSSATSAANGDNTFNFFDDFLGTTINTTKWAKVDTGGYISQNNGLTISNGDTVWGNTAMYTNSSFSRTSGFVVEGSYKSTMARGAAYQDTTMLWVKDSTTGTSYTNFTYALYPYQNGGTPACYIYEDGNSRGNCSPATFAANTQYTIKQIVYPTGGALYQMSTDKGSTWVTAYASSYSSATPFKVGFTHYQGGDILIGFIFIRSYASVEPTSSFGTEEAGAGSCGSSNGSYFASTPTTNLCSNGNASAVSGSGPWTWTCTGSTTVSCSANKTGWLSGWNYRKPATITNSSGSALTDYQVKVSVTYSSNMKSDFSDLRFTSSDGTTLLNYWIESYTASTSAIVWVKVPSVPTSTLTIYMYYGNSSATSAASGVSTFDFFDDFSGDLSKWTVSSGTWQIDSGQLYQSAQPDALTAIRSNYTGSNYIATAKVEPLDEYNNNLGPGVIVMGPSDLANNTGYAGILHKDYSTGTKECTIWRGIHNASTRGYSALGHVSLAWTSSTWYAVQVVFNGSLLQMYVDGTVCVQASDSTYTSGYFALGSQAMHARFDDVFVRKYASTEPTVALGTEEGNPGACGSSNGQYLSAAPTTNLCTAGTASAVSGSGPWTWICVGSTTASCSANLAYSSTTYSANGLSCLITSGTCSGSVIFKLENYAGGHADLPTGTSYAYKACCSGTGISNSCSESKHAVVLRLSDTTSGAHVEENSQSTSTYTNQACLSSTSSTVSCGYASSCSSLGSNYVCLGSISGATNAHVAACGVYSTQVCCQIGVPASSCTAVIKSTAWVTKSGTVQMCSDADTANSSDSCYSTCWKGTGTPDLTSSDWKCSTCKDTGGNTINCYNSGATYNWVLSGGHSSESDYTITSGSLTSPNPTFEFVDADSTRKATLSINSGMCTGSSFIPLPTWKEISPF